jgi:hypothetical protein
MGCLWKMPKRSSRGDLDGLVIADTVPPFRLASEEARRKLTVVDTTALVVEEILRSHHLLEPAAKSTTEA